MFPGRRSIIKAALWIVRKFLLVGPTFVLVLWGVSYLRFCVVSVLSPNRPVAFSYVSPAGVLKFEAKSYTIDPGRGEVSVRGFRVSGSGIGTLAAVGWVQISNLRWWTFADQTPSIDLYDLRANLVRLPNGQIEIERMLPAAASQGNATTAYHAVVHRARVWVKDLKGNPWTQEVRTEHAEVDGVGSNWVANGTAFLPGAGSAEVSIQNAGSYGLSVRASSPGMHLEKFWTHLVSDRTIHALDEVRDLQIQHAETSGPITLFHGVQGTWVVRGAARVTARGVTWKGYRLDVANFQGRLTESGVSGTAHFLSGPNRGLATGALRFAHPVAFGANLTAFVSDSNALPAAVRARLPAGTAFRNALFKGWVASSTPNDLGAQGTVTLKSVTFRQQTALNTQVDLYANRSAIRADLRSTQIAGASPAGCVVISLPSQLVTGYAQVTHVDLARVGAVLRVAGLSGSGNMVAAVRGTLRAPNLRFQADGQVSYAGRGISAGPDRGEVIGGFEHNRFDIERGFLRGPDGLIAATGNGLSSGSRLDVDVEARDLDLGRFVPKLHGVGSVSGRITGDYRDPKAQGTVRATDLEYEGQRAPVFLADLVVDRRSVKATRIAGISGAAELEGAATMTLPGQKLNGSFSVSGIELAQFSRDSLAGILDAPTVQVHGTLKHPTLVARLQGAQLVVGETVIESAEALVTADSAIANLDHVTANFAGGSISASGTYNLKTRSGDLVATSTPLDLSKLAPQLGQTVSLTGSASVGEAKVSYRDGVVAATASGKIDHIVANGAAIGDGNWNVKQDGAVTSGSLSIGQVEPILRVVDLDGSYNSKTHEVNGSFDANRAHLADVIAASERYMPESASSRTSALKRLSADLTVGATFSGTLESPQLQVKTLSLDDLKYDSTSLGRLSSSDLALVDKKWSFPNLELNGPVGAISASGSLIEGGSLDVQLSGKRLSAKALAPLVPEFDQSPAVVNFSAHATGTVDQPQATGSFDAEHVVAGIPPTSGGGDNDLKIQIPTLALDHGRLALSGSYQFNGFSGSLAASAPLDPAKGLVDGPLQGQISLDKRDIRQLPFVTTWLDPARSSGTVGGAIQIGGTVQEPLVTGGLDFSAETLGFRFSDPGAYLSRVDDQFKSVKGKVMLVNNAAVELTLSGNSDRGGGFSLKTDAALPDFKGLAQRQSTQIAQSVLDGALSGSLDLTRLSVRQSAPGGYFSAILDGSIPFGGTIRTPAIGLPEKAGTVSLSDVDVAVPKLPGGGETAGPRSENPTFNLTASLAGPAHVRSSTAEIYLNGSGTLHGSLADPVAKSDLVVESGSIRLPGGAVRLVSGGTIAFGYQHANLLTSAGSMDVDLVGKSSISATRIGQTTQRYDVTVYITGDPLQDNGLHFDAISDPPDLSSDDVLGLLGQRTLVQNLNNSSQTEAEQQVRDALVGFALPSVLDPYTNSLAKSLGLDYISLEYNALNLATLGAARTLNQDFSIQYRQQVGTPPPGYRAAYDFRLVYTPRTGPPLLRRLSLSVGADQDRPWKVALEYGTRFGGYTGPALKNRTVLSGPLKP